MNFSTFKNTVARDAVFIALDSGAARGMLIVAMMLTAGALGPQEFGRLTVVISTVTLLVSFIAEAMRVTAAKHVAASLPLSKQECGRVIATTLCATTLVAALLAVVLASAAPWIARVVFNTADLSDAFRLAACLVLFDAIQGTQSGILSGLKAFKGMACCGIVGGAIAIPAIYFGAQWRQIEGVMIALIGCGAINLLLRGSVLLVTVKRHYLPLRLAYKSSDLGVYTRFTLPAILNSLTWAPVHWCVLAILVNTSAGYIESGFFGIANQWFAAVLFIPNVIGNALLPRLATITAHGELATFESAVRTGVKVTFIIGLLTALIALAISTEVTALYGSEYAGARNPIIIIAMAGIAASINNLLGYALGAVDKMWSSFASGFVWAATYLVTATLFVHNGWGAAGVCAALLLAYVIKIFLQINALNESLRQARIHQKACAYSSS